MKKSLLIALTLFFAACLSKQEKDNGDIPQPGVFEDLDIGFVPDSFDATPRNLKFEVEDVKVAKKFLETDNSLKIFENKLGEEIMFIPKEHKNIQLIDVYGNAFIETIGNCYDQHRPLVLTPDAVWLTISQGVSIHINEHFETLEKKIFKGIKPRKLIIRNDSLEYDSKHWEDLISSMAAEASKYTNQNYYDFFVPEFSSTTKIHTTAYQITLLHSYKQAFEYVGESGCGIPYIRLAGSQRDWALIYARLARLDELGLKEWRLELEPIIKKFIDVFDGKINKKFWSNIYKNMEDYNAFYISGWIIKLFPYLEGMEEEGVFDEERGLTRFDKKYYKNEFLVGDKHLLSTLSSGDFPSGIMEVDLTWKNYFKDFSKKLNIYSGFFGMKQYEDKSLEPVISWAICEKGAKKARHKLRTKRHPKIADNEEYWTPYIVRKILRPATYNQREFKDPEKGLEFVKNQLVDALGKEYPKMDFEGDTVSFVVLINGKIENVDFKGRTQIEEFVKSFLNGLDNEWFPALADPKETFKMWEEKRDKNEDIKKIKVNSKVIMPLR